MMTITNILACTIVTQYISANTWTVNIALMLHKRKLGKKNELKINISESRNLVESF